MTDDFHRRAPIVSWAGPMVLAEQKIRIAGELLERNKIAEGVALLNECRAHIDEALEFIHASQVHG